MPRELITIDAAAAMLCMSRDWVAQACRKGIIDHVRASSGNKRFRRMPVLSSVEQFIAENRQEAREQRNAIAREHVRKAHLRRFSTVPQVF